MPKNFHVALKLQNIPLINLRNEFRMWNKLLRSRDFLNQFVEKRKPEPIRTRLLIWGGMPDDLFTLILQRIILGAESYVPNAVWLELGNSGRLTPELNKQVRNPGSLKLPPRKGTAYRYYNAIPLLLDPARALEQANPTLWEDVREFYQEVRNKILHGYQIGAHRPEVLHPSLDMFKNVYEWVDSWHDPSFKWGRYQAPNKP